MNVAAVLEKLDRFANFPKGWSFGGGDKFSPKTITGAKWLVERLGSYPGAQALDAFPARDGSIVICVYLGLEPKDDTLEFRVGVDTDEDESTAVVRDLMNVGPVDA